VYPVVVVTGPRQSGKTTLVRAVFSDYEYVNLESPNTLSRLAEDPIAFLNNVGSKVIFDEAQKYPELFSYLQVRVDEDQTPGQYILTGSENLSLSEKVGQSLAGRAGNLTLLPLSISELELAGRLPQSIDSLLLTGFYPRIYGQNVPAATFYSDYLTNYVERDVRQIQNVSSLINFRRFMQLLAGRAGLVFNSTSLANDVGVSHKTISDWLSILEASYIIFRLPPYYENFGKRVIKMPKVYFTDVGLLCYLIGIQNEEQLNVHFIRGALFENMIIIDLLKQIKNQKKNIQLYFWRDSNQNEIDLLVDLGLRKIPVEIKSSQTYSTDFLKGLRYWKKLTQENMGFVVYAGNEQFDSGGSRFVPWKNLTTLIDIAQS
jgi:predicted AAA+ superfamily ATPase